jgi:hypothetical protein
MTYRAQYVVGFDGSPSARSAVALTAHIAEFTFADVTAAFVLEEPDPWIPVAVMQDRHYLHEEVDRLLAEIEPDCPVLVVPRKSVKAESTTIDAVPAPAPA